MEDQGETRGGYLAAIAKRKGISVDEARAEVVAVQKRKIINLAKKLDPASGQASGSAGDDDAG